MTCCQLQLPAKTHPMTHPQLTIMHHMCTHAATCMHKPLPPRHPIHHSSPPHFLAPHSCSLDYLCTSFSLLMRSSTPPIIQLGYVILPNWPRLSSRPATNPFPSSRPVTGRNSAQAKNHFRSRMCGRTSTTTAVISSTIGLRDSHRRRAVVARTVAASQTSHAADAPSWAVARAKWPATL